MGKPILSKTEKGWVSKFLYCFPKSLFVIIQLPVLCLAFDLDAFFYGFTGVSFFQQDCAYYLSYFS